MYSPPKKKGPRAQKPKFTGKMLFRVGDTVRVIAGRDKGKEGKIIEVKPRIGKVVIEGINVVIKHQKPKQTSASGAPTGGGRIELNAPLYASKVQLLVDDKAGSTVSRIGIKTDADGNRVRYARKTGSVIENG